MDIFFLWGGVSFLFPFPPLALHPVFPPPTPPTHSTPRYRRYLRPKAYQCKGRFDCTSKQFGFLFPHPSSLCIPPPTSSATLDSRCIWTRRFLVGGVSAVAPPTLPVGENARRRCTLLGMRPSGGGVSGAAVAPSMSSGCRGSAALRHCFCSNCDDWIVGLPTAMFCFNLSASAICSLLTGGPPETRRLVL